MRYVSHSLVRIGAVLILALAAPAPVRARPVAAAAISVSGRVTDANGAGLSGISVEVTASDGDHRTRTAADGRYSVTNVPAGGRILIFVRASVDLRLADRNWNTSQTNADVRKDFQLVRGFLVRGRVRMPDGSFPPREGNVQLRPISFSLPQDEWLGGDLWSGDGSYQLVAPPGLYMLYVVGIPFGVYNPMPYADARASDVNDADVTLSALPVYAHPDGPPPLAVRMHVGAADAAGMATVTGDPGAAPGFHTVAVADVDTRLNAVTTAARDGSFSTRVFAPPGATLAVMYVRDPLWLGGWTGELTPLPKTLLRVPLPGGAGAQLSAVPPTYGGAGAQFSAVPTAFGGTGAAGSATGSYAFATCGAALRPPAKSDARWWINGTLTTPRDLNVRAGETLRVNATMRIASAAVPAGFNPTGVHAWCSIAFAPLFDANGRQLESLEHGFEDNQFMSTLMTPTGLPIERDSDDPAPFLASADVTGLRTVQAGVLEGSLTLNVTLPASMATGVYAPRLTFEVTGLPNNPANLVDIWVYDRAINEGYLPIVRVGSPQTPRLVTGLLTDSYTGGTRGALAREDRGRFDLATMVAYQPQKCIVPRFDALTGKSVSYDLGPYLPMISYTDRGFPVTPLVPFRFPTAPIQVTVRTPDGRTVTLGPAVLHQSLTRLPSRIDGGEVHLGAPYLADVYHLTNVERAFHYAFDQYGQHVIMVTGTIQDVWGNAYNLGGTYDVWVARELDMDSGQLPTTPYQVGDDFSPTVQVYPRMPAEVDATLTLLPNSNAQQAITARARGKANAYGYFHPPSGSFALSQPGEFRVDITATYTETNGTLWMGCYAWGNVIETPNTPLVAHGRRGVDNAPSTGLQWFLWENLSAADRKDHIYYPYQRGDVMWCRDIDIPGGDSLIPAATFSDSQGTIRGLMEQRNRLPHSALSQGPLANDFAGRVAVGEVPLFNACSNGHYPDRYPNEIDQWGYAYRSSERPGIRVRELVCEDSNIFGYWRFGDMYGAQIGMGLEGDLPNDFKFQFCGLVFRDTARRINQYAIYSAMWVLVPNEDPVGSRVMPPYQGAGGGPQDGGPLLRVKGQDIDVFFLPLGTQPGSVLETGDTFAFCGHVAPALDSRVTATLRSPSGAVVRSIDGHANKVGWFYEPSGNCIVNEPGVWTVEVRVVHDRVYPAIGSIPTSHNTGTVLGATQSRYSFYVAPKGATRLTLTSPTPGLLRWPNGLQPVVVRGLLPAGWGNTSVHYTITTPGFILAQGATTSSGGAFQVSYDPTAANRDFGVIDLRAPQEWRPGLSDQVRITLYASSAGQHRAATVTLFGEEVVPERDPSIRPRVWLPCVQRNE